tara:strand:+ start:583 stop:1308 length:726 start_codon:yes stop_codon:yes gene_type:complete
MGTYGGPHIIMDGLLACLDTTSTISAPDASSNWTSMIQPRSSIARNGSPDLTDIDGVRTWEFTAINQWFESSILGADNQPYLDATLEAWIYPKANVSSGDRGTIARINGNRSLYMSFNKSNRKLSTYWYSHATNGYHETGAAMADDEWHHVCSVHNYDDDNCYQYTNMVKTTATGTQADSTTYASVNPGQNIEIGMESTGRQFAGGIAIFRVYNTALTDAQVIQNYNAVCSKFGKPTVTSV